MKLCSGTSLAISPIIASYIIPRRPCGPIRLVGSLVMSPTWTRLASHWRIKMKQSSGISRCAGCPAPAHLFGCIDGYLKPETRPTNLYPPFQLTNDSTGFRIWKRMERSCCWQCCASGRYAITTSHNMKYIFQVWNQLCFLNDMDMSGYML